MKIFFIIVYCSLLFLHCREKNVKASVPLIPRDTTITPQNAYSHLFLDSISVETFIKSEVTSDIIANQILSFYNARNFQYAWFHKEGFTEQAEGFWNLHKDYISIGDSTVYHQQLHRQMDELLNADTVYFLQKDTLALTELRLTQHFFQFVQFAYEGKISPEQMQWHIPRRKLDAVVLLDSLFSKDSKLDDWQPLNPSFHRLQDAIFHYYSIQKRGGWPTIEPSRHKWSKGEQDTVIAQIKQRLRTSGDYSSADTTFLFTDSLENAVKRMKKSFGMKENGIIDATFIKELNIPVKDRIEQMLINLERMRWMPEQPFNFIVANIPEYRMHVFENGKKALSMNIVVGKAANRTVIFSDQLKYIVFSPYWNVPRSIVRNEILPAMRRSKSYLKRNNMEITGYSGELPIIRQKPGAGNALGKVKFIFPNRYNIYFHDTPSKSLFSRQRRAFSHGCIRLQRPFALTTYLLRNDDRWTTDSIQSAMNRKTEKWVTLDQPIPVFITYFTSWVDANGLVYFRDDIYGHDKRMKQHLFK